ncbi:50S ribosomal protein L11 methyltransferase [bacterium]|nr:50S ribosomal protein L11 methyltransferase [bacterium]
MRGLVWKELVISAPEELAAELEIFLTECRLGGWVVEAEVPELRWAAYLPCESDWEDRLQRVADGVRALGGRLEVRKNVVDEDWANCWKEFYHAKRVGRHVIICPSWEKYESKEGDKVILLDPGMAFGTGCHASTSMCLEMIEYVFSEYAPSTVLDVGTGSGILAAAAAKFGCQRLLASDSDPVAVKAAKENFSLNALDISPGVLEYVGVPLHKGRFKLVCANLVASLLCRLAEDLQEALDEGGVLICSGIVSERAQEVIDEFAQYGLRVLRRLEEDEWVCLLLGR